MSELLANIGSVFTQVMTWVGSVASTIAGTSTVGDTTTLNSPVLFLFCVGVPLCGLGVGMFNRLLHSRG